MGDFSSWTTSSIRKVATVSVPEPRLLSVQVWDRGMVSAVEKAIRDSDLGLNPQTEGQTIRVPLPPLTQERLTLLGEAVGMLGYLWVEEFWPVALCTVLLNLGQGVAWDGWYGDFVDGWLGLLTVWAPAAVCWLACRMFWSAPITCSMPSCCWLVEATICWKVWTLSWIWPEMPVMVCCVMSVRSLPAVTRFTASSVSMTDELMPRWMSPRIERTCVVASLA